LPRSLVVDVVFWSTLNGPPAAIPACHARTEPRPYLSFTQNGMLTLAWGVYFPGRVTPGLAA
jgi:hypothetical protein